MATTRDTQPKRRTVSPSSKVSRTPVQRTAQRPEPEEGPARRGVPESAKVTPREATEAREAAAATEEAQATEAAEKAAETAAAGVETPEKASDAATSSAAEASAPEEAAEEAAPAAPARPSVADRTGRVRPTVESTDEAAQERTTAPKSHPSLRAVGIVLITFAVILLGLLSYNRWYVHDDVADIQGVWLISGDAAIGTNAATIEFTDKAIILDINTAYVYSLDTRRKVIEFSFPPMDLTGSGHYRFSTDRSQLLIVDGEYSWLSTCASDFWWTLRCWWASLFGGKQPELGPTAGTTMLERVKQTSPASQSESDEGETIALSEQTE